VPVDHVIAIYARENGQGMAFPVPTESTPVVGGDAVGGSADGAQAQSQSQDGASAPVVGLRLASVPGAEAALSSAADDTGVRDDEPVPPSPGGGPRPSLKRIK
jgi:stringent starvation protein B